jgi:hypothetical protein
MINSTKPYKKGGIQGIGDTVKMMDEYDMNVLNDSIGPEQSGKTNPSKYNKNS